MWIAAGATCVIAAGLGAGPWDVLHQGVAARTGLSIGSVVTLTAAGSVVLWWPLGQRVGIGTVINTTLIGPFVSAGLAVAQSPPLLAVRVVLMIIGPAATAYGCVLCWRSGLGPGPRDGLMAGLVERGAPVWLARLGIELAVLFVGAACGGTVGIGTVWFAVAIGPCVQWFARRAPPDAS